MSCTGTDAVADETVSHDSSDELPDTVLTLLRCEFVAENAASDGEARAFGAAH